MAEQFRTLPAPRSAATIDNATTSVGVASAMGFTGGNFRILVDSEIMLVTGVSGTTFTVARNQEGTAASAHSNGATVAHVLTAGALDAHDQNDLAGYDLYANKPAAGVPGRIFLPSDGLFIERDNGSTWEKFGPVWPMTPPQSANFPTWVNQGSATCVDNKGAIFLEAGNSSNEQLRARLQAYPTPPFTVDMAFLTNVFPYSSPSITAGLCIRDSVSGKFQCYGVGNTDLHIRGYNYSSYSAASGGVTGWPGSGDNHQLEQNLIWVRYYDDGASTRVISISADGVTWQQMVSNSRTDYLTPNQIGFFANSNAGYYSSYPVDTGITVLHWSQH